jgi:ubiquinone/menaquinone biosynthesis C-methylase UbiE
MVKKSFADFYDEISNKSEAKERAGKVLKYIKKYNAKTQSILELGTGNGNVLINFPKNYELYGLDIEKKYVNLTKEKLPKAYLWTSSMHNFKINKKFDVIFSVFDSINFLKDINQWKETFENVYNHLEEGGLFIFDMYTKRVLEHNKGKPASFWKEKFGFASDEGIVNGNNLTWKFKIFERTNGDNYKLHNFEFNEKIFLDKQVESILKKYFKIIEKRDWENMGNPNKKSLRILYVLRKEKRVR